MLEPVTEGEPDPGLRWPYSVVLPAMPLNARQRCSLTIFRPYWGRGGGGGRLTPLNVMQGTTAPSPNVCVCLTELDELLLYIISRLIIIKAIQIRLWNIYCLGDFQSSTLCSACDGSSKLKNLHSKLYFGIRSSDSCLTLFVSMSLNFGAKIMHIKSSHTHLETSLFYACSLCFSLGIFWSSSQAFLTCSKHCRPLSSPVLWIAMEMRMSIVIFPVIS